MILLFPDDETLSLALTSGLVPPSACNAPAKGGRDAEGRVWIDTAAALDAAARKNLARLNVEFPRSTGQTLDLAVSGWVQFLPLRRQIPMADVTDKMPVLFELTGDLADVVGEILRLGNDRQAFRWVGGEGDERALLRVFGPPYYTLLRALDRQGAAAAVAYREAQPRVWVQLGYEHPLESQVRPPEGQILLLRPPHDWRSVPDGPYRDIYEVMEFTFAAPPETIAEAPRAERWRVPLRLTASGGSEPAELYVLRDDPIDQIDALVQHSDDQLLARLAFAIGTSDGKTVVVLRVRPSKLPPPVLVLRGLGYRPYLRLSQLFAPVGRRLHPPLRRDVVGRLLGGDGKTITWLRPLEEGDFQPESLPESAFRPLGEWVEYVVQHESAALEAWVGAHRFEFESFICNDEKPEKPAPKDAPKRPRPEAGPKSPRKIPETAKSRTAESFDAPDEDVALDPSAMEKELRALEKEFVEMTGPLESDERQSLWPRMGALNGDLGHHEAAAICWSHALWEMPGFPKEQLERWWRAETAGEKSPPDSPLAALEKIIHRGLPRASDLRQLAIVLGLLAADKVESQPLIGKVLRFLEKHEAKLGIRMVWLAWTALNQITHGDVLTLARARDRILERLYQHGLSPDFDLPNFLRFTGARTGERFRLLQDHLQRLRPLMQKWADEGFLHIPGTRVYVDLMFAYGLTRLGETGEARTIAENANHQLESRDEVHFWLIDAYQHRINRAALGTPDRDRLPDELLERLERASKLARYKIDRMREHSRILEPTEKIDPYRAWHGHYADELSQALAKLFDINDREQLAKKLTELLPSADGKGKQPWGVQAEPRILGAALELAPRLGDHFAEDLLFRMRRRLTSYKKPNERLFLLEKGIFLAGHFDKVDDVTLLVDHVQDLLTQDLSALSAAELDTLLGQTLRSLRRLGMREHVSRLLEATQASPQLRAANKPGPGQASAMRLQLQVAGGWFYFGQEAKGRRILDDARALLLENRLGPVEQTALACAYVSSLSQAPLEVTLARLMEFFRKVKGVSDTFTTSSHFSLSRLDVVEAVVLTLVHEDVTVEPQIRRWLDDDEFLVRRRIHRDVHDAMRTAGLS